MKPQFLLPTVIGGQSYIQKVLNIDRANLIGYWPLNETGGTTAVNVEGTSARNGTYARNVSTMGTGVGIGDGNTAPLFDATNDYCDIYSTSLRDAFNGAEGSLSCWAKVSASGVWTDGTGRGVARLAADANNRVYFEKISGNNGFNLIYEANTNDDRRQQSTSTIAWFHLVALWSANGDYVRHYFNGTQVGADHTSLGTWAGNLASTTTIIGAAATTPSSLFDGYIAHPALWTTQLSTSGITALATV